MKANSDCAFDDEYLSEGKQRRENREALYTSIMSSYFIYEYVYEY